MVLIRERSLTGIAETPVNSMESGDLLTGANPVSQVPALIFDDGSSLYDSPLICAYLDTLGDAAALSPPTDWAVRLREVSGDRVMEQAVKLRHEQLRPEVERSQRWQQCWRVNILRALDADERDAGLNDGFDLGVIAWGCALAYLQFRHADIGALDSRPTLAALMTRLDARPSFIDTRP